MIDERAFGTCYIALGSKSNGDTTTNSAATTAAAPLKKSIV